MRFFARTIVLLTAAMNLLTAQEPVWQRFDKAPHDYWNRQPTDAIAALMQRVSSGEVKLDDSSDKAYLVSLLKALDIPISSQLLVYSATSLQSGRIRPDNPRALYFNEEVYVGYVPGGDMEVSSVDPEAGPIFRIFRTRAGIATAQRSDRCMNCHAGRTSLALPGFTIESVIPSNTGASLEGFRREILGHTVPIEDRLGGWHVTGAMAKAKHLGNLMGTSDSRGIRRLPNPPGDQFDWDIYPTQTSDLLPHLIHEHQLAFHNLVTLAVYRTRDLTTLGNGSIRAQDLPILNDIARQIVRYCLFANEAKLPTGGLRPDPAFVKDFTARKKAIANGASLRDLDLRSRLFRYRCSYMVYTPAFAALPREIKERVLAGLAAALRETAPPAEFNYLPADEKKAIRTILHDTAVLP
jgi:hypothetical protein